MALGVWLETEPVRSNESFDLSSDSPFERIFVHTAGSPLRAIGTESIWNYCECATTESECKLKVADGERPRAGNRMTQAATSPSQHPSVVDTGTRDALDVRRRSTYERFAKPAIDRAVGVVLALLTLPIIVAVALAVFVDLGLPTLLRQERVGLNGKLFRVYKFRTMEPDRRTPDETSFVGSDRRMNHKSKDDPRLTRLGRFLRKWSLDELPQLWNVLLGDMSLVGPRPEMVQIVRHYEPWQHARHQVKPGVTGLWQVSARGEVPMHEATHIDLEYVKGLSFVADVKILAKTIPAALGERTGH